MLIALCEKSRLYCVMFEKYLGLLIKIDISSLPQDGDTFSNTLPVQSAWL